MKWEDYCAIDTKQKSFNSRETTNVGWRGLIHIDDDDFISALDEPHTRTEETHLRAHIPVAPDVASIYPDSSLRIASELEISITDYLQIEGAMEDSSFVKSQPRLPNIKD